MKRLYLDIETGPLNPFLLAKVMPEFDAPGNLKDPEKIKAAIEQKRRDWMEAAALKATTGEILAVTTAEDWAEPVMTVGDEKTLVKGIVDRLNAVDCGEQVYTWNGSGFDLPFICQRAAAYGIPAFRYLTNCYHGRWSWAEHFVDAMQVFTMQYNRAEGFGLDAVAKALGVGAKVGKGADFAQTLDADPAKAREYAINDVNLLRAIVERMGI